MSIKIHRTLIVVTIITSALFKSYRMATRFGILGGHATALKAVSGNPPQVGALILREMKLGRRYHGTDFKIGGLSQAPS